MQPDRSALVDLLRADLRPGERITFSTFCALLSKVLPAMDPMDHRQLAGQLWNGEQDRTFRSQRAA